MKLEQSFQVRAPVERVWETLVDIERVAPCLPGAEITEAGEDGTYRGMFSVRLGPTTAAYRGELNMEELDEAARRVVMRASGQDKRGQGSAKATIVSTMREDGDVTGDLGARNLLRSVQVHDVPCDDLGGGEDVDTPAALEALR